MNSKVLLLLVVAIFAVVIAEHHGSHENDHGNHDNGHHKTESGNHDNADMDDDHHRRHYKHKKHHKKHKVENAHGNHDNGHHETESGNHDNADMDEDHHRRHYKHKKHHKKHKVENAHGNHDNGHHETESGNHDNADMGEHHHRRHYKHKKHHKKHGHGRIDYTKDCSEKRTPIMKTFIAKHPKVFQKFKGCYFEMLTCLKNSEEQKKCECMTKMTMCSVEGSKDILKKVMQKQMGNMVKFAKKFGKGEILKRLAKKKNKHGIRKKMWMFDRIKNMTIKVWMNAIPKALKSVVMRNTRCTKQFKRNLCSNKTLECFERHQKSTNILLHQICAHYLTHCENSKEECQEEWRKCVRPDATKEIIPHDEIEKCHDESSKDVNFDVTQCLLDVKDAKIPTRHCRKKLCCEQVVDMEDAEEKYGQCMKVDDHDDQKP